MRPFQTVEVIAGTTLRTTWVSSGVTPTNIFSRLSTGSADTLVSSFAGVSSGNGFYYALHTVPNSGQWLVNEWQATIDGFPYFSRQLIWVRELRAGG